VSKEQGSFLPAFVVIIIIVIVIIGIVIGVMSHGTTALYAHTASRCFLTKDFSSSAKQSRNW
jgi:uncharacterized protein (DUF983 family)